MTTTRLAVLAALAALTAASAFARSDFRAMKERVFETQGCPEGSFSVTTAPDGSAISVLFDNFKVQGTEANGGFARVSCGMEVPLHLPAGYSLGVYKVDYRGFAHLGDKQRAELQVNYGTGSGARNRGKRFREALKGTYEGDFTFNEKLKGGILKRMGCGDEAVLNFVATLTLVSKKGATEGTMTLDSIDGAPAGGLVFGLDLKKCDR